MHTIRAFQTNVFLADVHSLHKRPVVLESNGLDFISIMNERCSQRCQRYQWCQPLLHSYLCICIEAMEGLSHQTIGAIEPNQNVLVHQIEQFWCLGCASAVLCCANAVPVLCQRWGDTCLNFVDKKAINAFQAWLLWANSATLIKTFVGIKDSQLLPEMQRILDLMI